MCLHLYLEDRRFIELLDLNVFQIWRHEEEHGIQNQRHVVQHR